MTRHRAHGPGGTLWHPWAAAVAVELAGSELLSAKERAAFEKMSVWAVGQLERARPIIAIAAPFKIAEYLIAISYLSEALARRR